MLPIAEALPVETTQPTEVPAIEPVLADESIYTAADVDVSRPRFRGSGLAVRPAPKWWRS
jgi:hypothetical protein